LKGFDYTFKKGDAWVSSERMASAVYFINMLQGIEEPDSGKINIGETVILALFPVGLVIREDMRVIEYVKNIAEHFPLAAGGSLSAAQFLQLFSSARTAIYLYLQAQRRRKRRLHLLSILFRNPNSSCWTSLPTTWTCRRWPSWRISSANSRVVDDRQPRPVLYGQAGRPSACAGRRRFVRDSRATFPYANGEAG